MKKMSENKKRVHRRDFKIHQFVNLSSLKQNKEKSLSRFVSPIFGNKVPDRTVVPGTRGDLGDRSKRFDAFRSKPMLDKKDLKEKYGSEYYEFTNLLSNKDREEYLGGKIVEENEETRVHEKPVKRIEPIGTRPKQVNHEIPFKTYEKVEEEVIVRKTNPKAFESNPFEEPEIETFKRETVIPKEVVVTKSFDFFEEEKPKPKKEKPITNDKPFITEKTYIKPPISLFKRHNRNTDEKPAWLLQQIDTINRTLEDFSIEGEVIGSTKGPTVTRYEVSLKPGINVNRISNIADNLMMNLQTRSLRIEAPIPGKPYVGLELPNVEPEIVAFGNVVDDKEFLESHDQPLKIALGVDIDGDNVYVDIAKMPHGLIAGATNSGKSVCINTILVSLLVKNSPKDLRLILIDPKMVELSAYDDLPHLITPVITDPKMAALGLDWAVDEMERRYRLFSKNKSKDIKTFNQNVERGRIDEEHLPYIVIVIDELADLMMASPTEVEASIQRLTQKARAAGIHLIVATQRPTTDVVKGTIKSNIPARIAFKVASHVDSATILDSSGAEKLLGKGDMLLKEVDRPYRLQGAYITDDEIYAVTDFIIEKNAAPEYVLEHTDLEQKVIDRSMAKDELFDEVARFVVTENTASINQITKTFNISFNRAQAMVQMLEDYGVVSESQGTRARDVLIDINELEELLYND